MLTEISNAVAEEFIYNKERGISFPTATELFNEEDWKYLNSIFDPETTTRPYKTLIKNNIHHYIEGVSKGVKWNKLIEEYNHEDLSWAFLEILFVHKNTAIKLKYFNDMGFTDYLD